MATIDLNPPQPLSLSSNPATSQVWEKWIASLSLYFLASNITDKSRQKALLLYLGGEDLREIYSTLDDKGTTFEEAKLVLDLYFLPKKNLTFERSKFRTATPLTGESSQSFITRLRSLANTCEFDKYSKESAIVDQFIEKTESQSLRRQLLRQTNLTLADLLSFAQTLEMSHAQAASMEVKAEPVEPYISEELNKISLKQQQNKQLYCYGCGSNKHIHGNDECPAKEKDCFTCGKRGHFSTVCRQKQRQNQHVKGQPKQSINHTNTQSALKPTQDSEFLFSLNSKNNLGKAHIGVEDVSIEFIIDSGASCNMIDKSAWHKLKMARPNIRLHKTEARIFPYGAEKPLNLLGIIYCNTSYENKRQISRIYVADCPTAGCLIGKDSSIELGLLRIDTLNTVTLQDDAWEKKYTSVFKGLGHLKNKKVTLKVKPDVRPVRQPLRRVPFHVRKNIEAEIQRLLDLDVIEKAEGPTSWVSPVVAVPKKDGSVRLCVDLRLVNQAICRRQYPIPTVDEILEKLSTGAVFSKIDLNMGYHQVELDEESRHLTTFSTSEGLYRYKRLVFGVSSAFEEFHELISSLFQNEPNIESIADDIIVFGKDEKEHNSALERCLHILSENNLTVNGKKCKFGIEEVSYFGYRVSKSGIKPSSEKVEAIKAFVEPKNSTELRSFLGLLTYLSRFIPNLADKTTPLRDLLKNNSTWVWNHSHQSCFNELKQSISNETNLAHFDQKLKSMLYVDAGPKGLGAMLIQERDGKRGVIAYASRSLSTTEQRYSQIEKEALAVIWGSEKFHIYLYGHRYDLYTDHKPLLKLYSASGKPSPRILRWSLRLLPYEFTLHHISGAENPVDILSRSPCQTLSDEDDTEHFINFVISHSIPKAIALSDLLNASENDYQLSSLREAIEKGSWNKIDKPFKTLKNELSCKQGLIMRGCRIVVPESLREQVLNIAHESHLGIEKTKALLRTKVWWPKIDSEIKDKIKNCITCTQLQPSEPLEPLRMSQMPPAWQNLHIDLCGPLPTGETLLGVIDSGSRWPEIFILRDTSATTINKHLQYLFSNFGIPKQITSDNGPQFISKEFAKFCSEWSIHHRKITPYYPQANAEIERFFRTILKIIKASVAEGTDFVSAIRKFLLTYRNTPHCTTGVSPAKLLIGRNLSDKIFSFTPRMSKIYVAAQEKDSIMKEKIKHYADRKAKVSHIYPGDFVILKQQKSNKLSPNFGRNTFKVKNRNGSSLILQCENGKIIMRHVSAVKKVGLETVSPPIETEGDDNICSNGSTNLESSEEPNETLESHSNSPSPKRMDRKVFMDFPNQIINQPTIVADLRKSTRKTHGIPPNKWGSG